MNREFLRRGSSRPVLLKDLTDGWPAMKRWTFDHFAKTYGSERIIVTDFLGSKNLHKVSFAHYLDYVRAPSADFLPGQRAETPWYSPYWSPFVDHPELSADFDVSETVENWMPDASCIDAPEGSSEALFAHWTLRGFSWLFIGPEGTFTPRHLDTLNTHAWNTQIRGRKRFDLWAPGTPLEDETPDIQVVLEPGETLIIPMGWAHAVVALEASISLTGNFFNRTNSAAFFHTIYSQPDVWQAKARLVPALKAQLVP
ncbi:cupin-like domain-containing protein [Pseudophaeobacter sp.]|uniref:cupin-like domain-containing protein n=1 Tax=Pseudophaeobacter sp. TaxID=1971739 RepID=UPI0032968C00